MSNSAFEIIFKIESSYYLAGTIRTSHKKVELFFHFPWGSREECQNQEIGGKSIEPAHLPDHVSFHRDGTIHTKYRDIKKKNKHSNKLNPGINVFNLSQGHFLPIYLESIALNSVSAGKRLKCIVPTEHQKRKSYDVTGLKSASIILISKCASINPAHLLSAHGFQLLTRVGKIPILANIFETIDKNQLPGGGASERDTQLLVMVVEDTWPEQEPVVIMPETSKKVLLGNFVTLPPMDLIAKMVNLNK